MNDRAQNDEEWWNNYVNAYNAYINAMMSLYANPARYMDLPALPKS
jgi:hypothetical protein